MPKSADYTFGVLADTHIPDRARSLHPGVIPLFEGAGVKAILHAGDVSTGAVLEQLQALAPVHAVRGNRDWWGLRHLPSTLTLNVNGVPIALTHGHDGWRNYLLEKLSMSLQGYRFPRYRSQLLASLPGARVIVFGHTHRPLNQWYEGILLFNPGTPSGLERAYPPTAGLLHISAHGQIQSRLQVLKSSPGERLHRPS